MIVSEDSWGHAALEDEPKGAGHQGYWLWLIRWVSPPFVRLSLRLDLHPNHVTILAFLAGVTGVSLVSTGAYLSSVIGAFLLNIQYLLDDVDGHLARQTGRTSIYGGYLDGLIAQIIWPLLFVAAGIHVFRSPEQPVVGLGADRMAFLILGGAASMAAVQRRLARIRMREWVRELVGPDGVVLGLALKRRPTDRAPSLGFFIHHHVIGLSGTVLPGLLLAAFLRRIDVFLLVMAPAVLIDFCLWIATSLRALRRAERRIRGVDP